MNAVLQFSPNAFRQAKGLIPYYNATKTGFYAGNAYGLRERVRKPWWLPMAKTKRYKVPLKCVIPNEDSLEINRLYNIYRTKCRSIVYFFEQEVEKEKQSLADATSEMSIKEEIEEFDRCVKENAKWNAEIAKNREIRLQELDKERAEQIKNIVKHREEKHKDNIQKAEDQIQTWKEISHTFITRDKLDGAIEKALGDVVDYNYAIDIDGNIYHGREGGPSEEDVKKTASA